MRLTKLYLISFFSIAFISVNAQNWDIDILKAINPNPPSSDYWKITSASAYIIGGGVPIGMLTAGLINNDVKLKRKSYEMLGAIAIELIITESLKSAVGRMRPADKYPDDVFPYKELNARSFPSGHTSLAFATAASLSIQFKKWWITVPAYVWASTVGYSRMYLGVHYPTDILGGAAIGIGSAYLSHWLNQKYFLSKKSKKLVLL